MDIQKMIREYTNWLNSEFSAVQVGDYFELTTPYLDRYNDYLQIYVRQNSNGTYLITDDGVIITNLKSSGVSFSHSKRRREMLDKIVRNFGVTLNGDNLEVHATRNDYPQKKHMLIQAMLSVDDIFIAEPNAVKNFFTEDVGLFFDSNDIFYSRDFSLVGKTGSLIIYDYHMQRTREKPERFCKPINHVSKNTRDITIFNWLDTKEKRADNSQLILFLNDAHEIDDADLEAFRSYDVTFILWSERQKPTNLSLLAS